MAILNLQIEVDWITDEMTLDDTIKENLIRKIEEKVSTQTINNIKETVEQKISSQADSLISIAIDNEIQKFLTTPKNITDKYGDVIRDNVTVTMLIKEKIDGMMEQKRYDENGKTGEYSEKKYTKFEYFIRNDAQKIINTKTEQMTKAVEKQIETLVSDKIKAHVADGLTNMIMDNSTALSLKPNKKE